MAILPPSMLESLQARPNRWVGRLTGPRGEDIRQRLELALGLLPVDVRDEIVRAMGETARVEWARAAVSALTLAGCGGSRPTGLLSDDLIGMVDRDGEPFGLSVLAFSIVEHPSGQPEDVARLVAALDATFGVRRFVLYLSKRIPEGFDPAPIARAVRLWLAAIDRGKWHGQQAIYEDEDVKLELMLTGDEGQPSRVLTVGPVVSLERLAIVDATLVERAERYAKQHGALRLVFALGGSRPWRMPRGYVEQLLYGTADWVHTTSSDEERSYEAGFSPNGRCLFSDPVCRNLAGLWWLEPHEADPFAFRSWTHDNPWSDFAEGIPGVPGMRFRLHGPQEDVGARGRRSIVLRWTASTPTLWSPSP